MSRANLRKLYAIATQDQKNAGFLWYPEAYAIAAEVCPADPIRGAGILAALSPQKTWNQNVHLARTAAASGYAIGHWGAQNRKAQFILDGGDPRECLNGPKERAFFECIAAPWTDSGFVCLDRHAINAWHGYLCEDDARKRFAGSKRNYALVSADFVAVARELSILPHQLQAVLWVVWRDLCAGARGPFRLVDVA